MRTQKSKRKREKYIIDNRWHGYYMEDMECQYCLHWKSRKRKCSRPKCAYQEEKANAVNNGRIKRRRGVMKWDS